MESSSEEELDAIEEVEEFYCVVCEKSFKSAKQLDNHERSKKHKQNLAELKRMLQEEEEIVAGQATPLFVYFQNPYIRLVTRSVRLKGLGLAMPVRQTPVSRMTV